METKIQQLAERVITRIAPTKFGKYRTAMVDMSKHYDPSAEAYAVKFDNGYGASIIRNNMSYGHQDNLFELAVTFGEKQGLCYDTPITSDVEGWLTREEVAAMLAKIEELTILEA